jgi:hypothetical protein
MCEKQQQKQYNGDPVLFKEIQQKEVDVCRKIYSGLVCVYMARRLHPLPPSRML